MICIILLWWSCNFNRRTPHPKETIQLLKIEFKDQVIPREGKINGFTKSCDLTPLKISLQSNPELEDEIIQVIGKIIMLKCKHFRINKILIQHF